jgi:hypothetical protein
MRIKRPMAESKTMHQYTQEASLKALVQLRNSFQNVHPELYKDIIQLEKKIKAYEPR